MIGLNLVWVVLLISYIAIFAALIVTRLLLTSKEQVRFSFLRNFPYEVITFYPGKSCVYKTFLFIFAGLCFAPIFVIVPLIGEFGDLGWLTVVNSVLYGICGILIVSIHLFEAKFIKTHSLLVSLLIALAILSSSLSALYSMLTYSVYNRFHEGSPLAIGCFSLFVLAVLFDLFIGFNPRLKDWAKLEAYTNDDGSVSYDRPKIFPLALSEWLIIFSVFFSEVIFFISLIHM